MKTTLKNPKKPIRIGMLSLGCPKTLVDSEHILGKLSPEFYTITPSVTNCDVALLNTCSFIQDAKEESIDRILELVELKREKKIKAVVVIGCLVQRYPKPLQNQLKEVDAFIGSSDYDKIPEVINRVTQGDKVFSVRTPGYLATAVEPRIALTPKHYRYLKISEGCDHICAFCAIPSFRGKHRSRSIGDVVTEARHLVSEGAKELILTGQDTTYFGKDTSGKFLLPELLQALDQTSGAEWLRLLYAYPSCITDDLIAAMRNNSHICHYLDMPLQHASDPMLLAMRRGITQRRTYDLIRKFRDQIPDLAIRTTFIVGFPGETEKDFQELLSFMTEMKFERLGIFKYSHEDGTDAAKLPAPVSEKIKDERFNQAMALQQSISKENNAKLLGKTLKVLIDDQDEETQGQWVGRTYMDAPEVDGSIFVRSAKPLNPGNFYQTKITATQEYDLVGDAFPTTR